MKQVISNLEVALRKITKEISEAKGLQNIYQREADILATLVSTYEGCLHCEKLKGTKDA